MSFCSSQYTRISRNNEINIIHFHWHLNRTQIMIGFWFVIWTENRTKHFSNEVNSKNWRITKWSTDRDTQREKIIHKLWLSFSMLIMHSTNSWILYPLDGVHTIPPHIRCITILASTFMYLLLFLIIFFLSRFTRESSNIMLSVLHKFTLHQHSFRIRFAPLTLLRSYF